MSKETLEIMRSRRTTRRYTEQDVNEEQVETLLEMAMYAPSRLNRQPWHFVVIRDAELQRQLGEQLRVRPYLEEAPVVIAVGASPKASPTWIMDVSAATQNILLAAEAIGLGATWISSPDSVVWDECEETMRQELGVPADVRIPTLIAVGHPDREMAPHAKERRFDRTKVHYGKWGALKLD